MIKTLKKDKARGIIFISLYSGMVCETFNPIKPKMNINAIITIRIKHMVSEAYHGISYFLYCEYPAITTYLMKI